MTVAGRLARHAVATRYDDLPEPAIAAAKIFLLDTLGVAVAGSSLPEAAAIHAAAREWGLGGQAAVLGTGYRLPAPAAAFVNGYQAHGQEFDCVHEPAVIHAMSTVVPATLAAAERRGGVGGREFLAAVAAGVDVAVTVGLNPAGAWGFFRPATAGAFGAAAAVGKIAGLDAALIADAFGVVYGQVSGTMQPHAEGVPLLPLQIGFAARNAVAAVDLARAGIHGTRETFEGKYGYFALFEAGWDPGSALAEMGRHWRIAEISHKPFPSGRATHGLVDGLLRLKAQHGFSAADIEQVTLLASPLIAQLVARPLISDPAPSYARLCAAYVGAVALLRGGVGLDDFSAGRLTDPAIHALAKKIAVAIDEANTAKTLLPQTLSVRLRNGNSHRLEITEVLGSPARPLTRGQHLAKFRACWSKSAAALPAARADAVIDAVDRIEALDDIGGLASLLAP